MTLIWPFFHRHTSQKPCCRILWIERSNFGFSNFLQSQHKIETLLYHITPKNQKYLENWRNGTTLLLKFQFFLQFCQRDFGWVKFGINLRLNHRFFGTDELMKKDGKLPQLPAGTFKFFLTLIVTEIFQFQSSLKF